ncbi:hypothetical protein KEJ36_05415, partial [Candidatus Bathyarchaeota archaeon]|nr:hypothetical protein [Candidatus Bathyarchaeota archaeon]
PIIRLLVMGTVRTAGGGCMCPANALLTALLRHILLRAGEAVIMDMEAGLEHLGRGVVRGFDILLIIVEPGTQSLETAQRIHQLAKGLGVKKMAFVGNKVRSPKEEDYLASALERLGMSLLLSIPYDERVMEADLLGVAPMDLSPLPKAIESIRRLKECLA